MEALIGFILQAAGGGFGARLLQVLQKDKKGSILKLITGVIGGAGAGGAMDTIDPELQTAIASLFGGADGAGGPAANLIQGLVGGLVLPLIVGYIRRKKTEAKTPDGEVS